jgi:hypothetical protein
VHDDASGRGENSSRKCFTANALLPPSGQGKAPRGRISRRLPGLRARDRRSRLEPRSVEGRKATVEGLLASEPIY